jgi:hypothetical protein
MTCAGIVNLMMLSNKKSTLLAELKGPCHCNAFSLNEHGTLEDTQQK